MKKTLTILFLFGIFTVQAQSYGYGIGMQAEPDYYNPYSYYGYPSQQINVQVDNNITIGQPSSNSSNNEVKQYVVKLMTQYDSIVKVYNTKFILVGFETWEFYAPKKTVQYKIYLKNSCNFTIQITQTTN